VLFVCLSVACLDLTREQKDVGRGALKKQDRKMTDKMSGVENVGLENDRLEFDRQEFD